MRSPPTSPASGCISAISPRPCPNLRLYPDFDDNLRQAFRRETELFFQSIVQDDRSVLTLLDADYTFLNERLARHYDVPNVYGDRFRRVALPTDSQRRGLLGHGSILTVTSHSTRTSPVRRGKWILENILGTPPPPPPANVPPLKENGSGGGAKTMRELMAEHRSNAVCAACHRSIDPLGLALENFDAVGRWRTRGEDGAAVDASGSMPGGEAFDGVDGLRQALLARPDVFVGDADGKADDVCAGPRRHLRRRARRARDPSPGRCRWLPLLRSRGSDCAKCAVSDEARRRRAECDRRRRAVSGSGGWGLEARDRTRIQSEPRVSGPESGD